MGVTGQVKGQLCKPGSLLYKKQIYNMKQKIAAHCREGGGSS